MENYGEGKGPVVQCIICHRHISLDESAEREGIAAGLNYVKCPNGHAAHIDPCIKNWAKHSKNCPLCNTPYGSAVLKLFESFIEEERKKAEEERRRKLEEIQKAELEKKRRELELKNDLIKAKNLISQNKIDDALDLLYDIIDNRDKNNPDALFLLGQAHFRNNRYDLAISNFMKLVKLKFDYPYGFYYLGKSYEMLGLKDKAKWAYQRALLNLQKHADEPGIPEMKKKRFLQLIEEINSVMKNL